LPLQNRPNRALGETTQAKCVAMGCSLYAQVLNLFKEQMNPPDRGPNGNKEREVAE